MESIAVKIYARVSTEDQNVEQQVEYLKKWAERTLYKGEYRINIVGVVKDKESGTLPLQERKRFDKLLKQTAEQGVSVLIINLDRLTRNWFDENFIEKHFVDNWEKSKLISAYDDINLSNATGRAMFRFKMVINCLYPEDMREKQIVGIERAKLEGKYKGGKIGRKCPHG